MKRVIASLFGTVAGLVMLLGFKTHTQTATIPAAVSTTSGDGSGTSGTSGTNTSTASGSGNSSSTKSTTKTSSGTQTYTGDSVNTQWGPVQVQITVTNGKITSATAVVYPSGNPRDQEINAYAIPQLNTETVNANSAQIDSISGATVTSGGYIGSLQSAIDKAGL